MSDMVRRERLAFRVRPARTSLMLVVVRLELTAPRMVLLERKFGTGAESFTINSLLTLEYPRVIKRTALAFVTFLIVVVGLETESAAVANHLCKGDLGQLLGSWGACRDTRWRTWLWGRR